MKTQDKVRTPSRARQASGEPRLAAARPADGFRAWLLAGADRRWQAALLKTPWGRSHIRPMRLAEHGDATASATQHNLVGVLDRRAVRVRGFSDVKALGASADDRARHQLVEHMLADAVENGAEVALLLSPLDPEWCRAHGFVDITPETVTLSVQPGSLPGAPLVMIRAGEDRDLPALAAMGQLQAAPFRFSLDRDTDFIQHGIISRRLLSGLAPSGTCDLHFFVVEEGATAVAYVVLSVVGNEWCVEACGDLDPANSRVGYLLQALLAREASTVPPIIRGWLPESMVPMQVTVVASERTPTTVMAALIGPAASTTPLTAADALYWKADVF